MNQFEENYQKYYQLRILLMNRVCNLFLKEHICYRQCPSMESKQMFDRFMGNEIETVEIDITTINSQCIGEFIKHSHLKEYNKIEISGPKILLNKFLNQNPKDKKINIFINSVKSITNTFNLWDLDLINEKQLIDSELKEYKYFEQPFTQQYCNWYEFFERQYGEAYDYVQHFIIIFTSKQMLNAYREIYPHFIICTQPQTNISGVGLTRYSLIVLAYYLNLKRILCLDDNVVDFKVFMNDEYQQLTQLTIFENLFKLKKLNNININSIGYIGFSIGRPLNDSIQELNLKKRELIKDDYVKINIDENQQIDLSYRQYLHRINNLEEITWSPFGENPLINPHRSKAVLFNTELLKKNNFNYNFLHQFGEDIYFSKLIFLAGLTIIQLNINFVQPSDKRRQKIIKYEKKERNRFLSKNEIEILNNNWFVEIMADLIIMHGKIIYFDQFGVYAGSGVYGPLRIITIYDHQQIIKTLNEKKQDQNLSRYIDKAHVGSIDNYQVYYLKPNKYIFNLTNLSQNWRITHVDKYLITDQNFSEIKNAEKYQNTINTLINYHIPIYDLASHSDDVLYPSSGQMKYVLEYEFFDNKIYQHFSKFCKDLRFLGLIKKIYDKIILIKYQNKKINYLLMDDFIFYLDNFNIDPLNIYRMIILLVLYIRFNLIKKILENKIQLSPLQYDKLIFVFGDIKTSFYEYYKITSLIEEIINKLLNNSIMINNQYIIQIFLDDIRKDINDVYNLILFNNKKN